MRRLLALFLSTTPFVRGCLRQRRPVESEVRRRQPMEVVQQILDTRGCTASTCHGAPAAEAAGGLDLRPEGFYDHVVNITARSANLPLVFPAEEERSVLYLKMAAKTLGTDLSDIGVAGSPMPSSSDVLTKEELEVIRAWIRGGAPRVGVVKDAPDLLGCGDALEPSPNKIPPLPPPPADKGIQLRSGGWELPAESEDEVCYVTYHDYTDVVPESAKLPCPKHTAGRAAIASRTRACSWRRNPQSHHSIVESYIPPPESPEQWDPHFGVWKNWECVGGDDAGRRATPTAQGTCGGSGQCATAPTTSIACIGYVNGPRALGTALGFFGRASSRLNISIAQEGTLFEDYPEGVYGVIPVVGFTLWNSHSFNLTKEDTTVDQYINLTYATADERQYLREDLTMLDNIFAMGTVPPFTSVEACATFTMPIGSRIMSLTSHTHKFGRDFRIWYPPNESCEAGPDCLPPEREADYRSFIYQDPLYQYFEGDNVIDLDSPEPDDRTFRYCAIWDNGESNSLEVRKHSERPDAGSCDFGEANDFVGQCGCDPQERACLGGPNEGMICDGDDSLCGGGVCDACPVWGGVTTEEGDVRRPGRLLPHRITFGISGAYGSRLSFCQSPGESA